MLNVVTDEWKDEQFYLAHAVRPCRGELVSGDAVLMIRDANYIIIGVIDGLGHGKAAAEISQALRQYFEAEYKDQDLTTLVKNAHQHFMGSRGAVLGLIKVFNDGQLEYVGIGNIRGRIIRSHGQTMELIPRDGALGVRMHSINSSFEQLLPDDKLLLFSDGVSRRVVRGKLVFPVVEAKKFVNKIIKEYGKDHDDASVMYLIKNHEGV